MENRFLLIKTSMPVKAVNAGLFISRGSGIHPSRIIDSYEVIFVRSGILDLQEENEEYSIHEGQVLILRPNCRHNGIKPYPNDLSFYWIHFYIDEEMMKTQDQSFSLPRYVRLAKPEQLTELFRRFLDEQESIQKNQILLNLLIMEILCKIADSNNSLSNHCPAATLAGLADKYISIHFHERLSTKIIAEEMACNPDYLGRIYHKVYRITLTDAIHKYRIKYSCSLLMDSTFNINEVARMSGYEDPCYFRRVFKYHKSMSPSTYRRSYALVHINTE